MYMLSGRLSPILASQIVSIRIQGMRYHGAPLYSAGSFKSQSIHGHSHSDATCFQFVKGQMNLMTHDKENLIHLAVRVVLFKSDLVGSDLSADAYPGSLDFGPPRSGRIRQFDGNMRMQNLHVGLVLIFFKYLKKLNVQNNCVESS
jgi:hypothetical protein